MIEIALFDSDPCEQYQLDDMLSAIMFSRDDFNITFYSSYTLFVCDIAQRIKCYDLVFINLATDDNIGLKAAEGARHYCSNIEIVIIGTDYSFLRFGYKVKALDYILKPYNKNQLSETIARFYEYVNKDEYFSYKVGSCFEKIKLDNILYVASNGRKLTAVMATQRESVFYGKLDELEKKLVQKGFLRVHQSYLVNIRAVRQLQKDTLLMENNDKIPISRTKTDAVKDIFAPIY